MNSYVKMDSQLLEPWLPCSVIITGVSSLERLRARVHCNLGPISSLIPMRYFVENGSSVISETIDHVLSLYIFFLVGGGVQWPLLMHAENRNNIKIASTSKGFHGVPGGKQSSI